MLRDEPKIGPQSGDIFVLNMLEKTPVPTMEQSVNKVEDSESSEPEEQ